MAYGSFDECFGYVNLERYSLSVCQAFVRNFSRNISIRIVGVKVFHGALVRLIDKGPFTLKFGPEPLVASSVGLPRSK
jgi:hypothetical protein